MTKFKKGARVIVFYSDDLIFNGRVHSIHRGTQKQNLQWVMYRIVDSSDKLWWIKGDRLELDKGYYRNQKIASIL